MSYMQFKTPFMELYEELSYLNEAVPKHPDIYFKDIIGYKDGQPVLKQVDTPAQKTLFDFVKKDQPTPLGLPEDKQDWVINSSRLSTNTRIEMICSNPACRYGGVFTPTIKQINERIWGVNKAWSKFASEQSVEDIALCFGCVDDRNMSKKKVSTTGVDIWGAYKMAEIGGFDAEGNVAKITNSNNNLLKYLHKKASLVLNPDLENIEPKYWPAFDEKRTFYYNCPSCGLPHALQGPSLRGRKAASVSAAQLVRCPSCKLREDGEYSEDYGTSIAKIKEIWERIPDWLFEDKSLGEDAILTKKGYNSLLNNNTITASSNKLFLAGLKLAFELADSDKEPKIKAAKHLTKESELKIPLICTNLDCQTYNNGIKHEYISTLHLVNKGIYFGCDSCKNRGRSHSAAELALKKAVEILFGVEHQKTVKIKPYHEIDILFNYNGKMFGIEYDGKRYHQDPKTLSADESKMKIFNEKQNIFFIRVREKGCLEFSNSIDPAKVIEVDGWFLGLSQEKYLKCLTQIGQIVTDNPNYVIPENTIEQLTALAKSSKAG